MVGASDSELSVTASAALLDWSSEVVLAEEDVVSTCLEEVVGAGTDEEVVSTCLEEVVEAGAAEEVVLTLLEEVVEAGAEEELSFVEETTGALDDSTVEVLSSTALEEVSGIEVVMVRVSERVLVTSTKLVVETIVVGSSEDSTEEDSAEDSAEEDSAADDVLMTEDKVVG